MPVPPVVYWTSPLVKVSTLFIESLWDNSPSKIYENISNSRCYKQLVCSKHRKKEQTCKLKVDEISWKRDGVPCEWEIRFQGQLYPHWWPLKVQSPGTWDHNSRRTRRYEMISTIHDLLSLGRQICALAIVDSGKSYSKKSKKSDFWCLYSVDGVDIRRIALKGWKVSGEVAV